VAALVGVTEAVEQANECPRFDISPKQLEAAIQAIYGALRKH
jgi:hypothetical protein